MNTSATSAAPRAEHDALDASPRVPTTYLPTNVLLPLLPSYYLLPPVAEDAVSIFTFKSAVRRRPPSLRRTPRAFRAGGTLVVRVAMSATRLQIGIIRLVYQPISEHSLAMRGHSLVVKFMEFSTVFSIFNAWRRQILPPVP